MSVAKLCADQLRVISNNYGVKLKSSHAHELVAAFFGYKSKAALLSDTLAPIENIGQAQIWGVTIIGTKRYSKQKSLSQL